MEVYFLQYGNYGMYPSDNQPPKKQRPTWGTVFLTGLICFIVGALTCGIVIAATSPASVNGPLVTATPSFGLTTPEPSISFTPAGTPLPTPTPTQTPTPSAVISTPEPSIGGGTPSSSGAGSFADIYEKLSPSVVFVSNGIYSYSDVTDRNNEEFVSSGSGIVLSADGYILTNEHVIADAEVLKITYQGVDYHATVVGSDATVDLAVIKAEGATGFIPAAIGNSDNIRVGESVIAIGNPLSTLYNTVTCGIISGIDREVNDDGKVMNLIQTDAAINPGNSGGPLIDANGTVIGICNMKSVIAGYDEYGNVIYSEGIGYAIPINQAMEVANLLIENGYIPRPGIGIKGYEVTQFISEETLIPQGVCVTDVMYGGPCYVAGIRPNDVIIGVEGVQVTAFADLTDRIESMNIGDKLKLRIWRNGMEADVEITLGDMNEINRVHDEYVKEHPEYTQAPNG